MKVVCTQENLSRAVSATERCTGRQGSLPILGNILLETENGRLKISATNLEVGIIARIGAKVEDEGSITVPAKVFSQFIGNLPETEVISLESDGQKISVSCGKYNARIKGLSSNEFPIIPKWKEGGSVELSAQSFRAALARLLPCVAPNESRLELTGVNFLFSDGLLSLAATDSFRLLEEVIPFKILSETSFQEAFSQQNSVILPATTLLEVSRSIRQGEETLSIAFEESQAFFFCGGVEIISRLITGKFPDYKQIIPSDFSFFAMIPREEFARAVRMAGVFSSGEVALELCPEEGVLLVEAVSKSVGEEKSEVAIVSSRGDGRLRVVFPVKTLLDGIGFVGTEYVGFFANTSSTPVVLRMMEKELPREGFTYVMMPIRK